IVERRAGNRSIECPQCRGVGISVCGNCREGWSLCEACKGYRKTSCTDCSGSGELLRSLSIRVDYKPEHANALLFPSNFPDYVMKRFDNARYANVSRRVFSIDGPEAVALEEIAEIHHEALRMKIEETAARLKVACGNGERRVGKNLVEVLSCRAIAVQYSFEDKNYELWIVGEQGDVHCRTSPIHEYDQ